MERLPPFALLHQGRFLAVNGWIAHGAVQVWSDSIGIPVVAPNEDRVDSLRLQFDRISSDPELVGNFLAELHEVHDFDHRNA
jgi:hypothetical protein